MKSQSSLLEILREQKKKKNRPLKIIVDWDDCLQPLKVASIYNFSNKLGEFRDFFERFWETATIRGSFSGDRASVSVSDEHALDKLDKEEEKEAIQKFLEMRKFLRKNPDRYSETYYGSAKRFRAPLTSLAEDLLKALQEDLIGRLILISSYRDNYDVVIARDKENKMKKVFGNFPQTETELTLTGKDKKTGEYVPHRWQRINELCPDFDVFVDDNPTIIKKAAANITDKDKIYILPDYKTNRHVTGSNIYHVKTTVSDLKDEDFNIAALEIKTKQLEQELQKIKKTKTNPNSWWLIPLVAVIFLGLILILLTVKRKRSRE